jgi:site-specific recombinase XerD
MGGDEVSAFLSGLATVHLVSASTQNQALAALLFLYQVVLETQLPWIQGVVHAKRPVRLPVVLTRTEVRSLLEKLEGDAGVVARLCMAAACDYWRR